MSAATEHHDLPDELAEELYGKDKLGIWKQVCVTDPSDTKRVSQRGGYTAIDAYSQIQRATELFGPMGSGWGLEGVRWEHIVAGGEVVAMTVEATFSYPGGAFPVSADKAYRPGDEVRKKLITELITKGLSYLGFNADVFLGAFDGKEYTPPGGSAAPRDESPPAEKSLPRQLFERMVARCQTLGIDPNTYAPGQLRSICQREQVDPADTEKLQAARSVIEREIDAYTGPDEQAGKDFVDPNIGNDGQPVSTPAADDGPPPAEDAPPTLGDDPKRMAALHAWATNDLGADGDPHQLLHDALPEGIESLNDLPVNRVGPLKRRVRLIWNGKAE